MPRPGLLLRFAATVLALSAANLASAQGTKTPPTKAQATKQDAATKAAAPQTKAAPPSTKTQSPPATKTQQPADTKTQPQAATKQGAPTTTKTTPGTGTKAAPGGAARPGLAVAAETTAAKPPVINREVFEYDGGGRRDPFFSLLSSAELRPAITDLKLMGIIYDESGVRPVAVMRDIATNTQYRVTTGMTLGRLRVALIKRRAVIFSIEEFGLNRQDSLILGDTTKVRGR